MTVLPLPLSPKTAMCCSSTLLSCMSGPYLAAGGSPIRRGCHEA